MAASRQAFDAHLRAEHGVEDLIGVDESGRGPLAGPVVAAAVLLPPGRIPELSGARDCKLLPPRRREFFYDLICRRARRISVAWAHPREIERDNILAAALSAMGRAVRRVQTARCLVLVDGNRPVPSCGRPQLPIVGGDDRSLSIACASIVAKVLRDRWMVRLDRRFPGYGLARHKGYGTRAHLAALERLGPAPVHRMTYAGVVQ